MNKFLFVLLLFLLPLPSRSATWTRPYIDGLVQQRRLKPLPPDQPISRAEYAILLEQAFLILPKVRQSKGFTDLKPSHWSYRPLINAYEGGFLSGDGAHIYPDRPLTRLEVMVSLANGLQLPIDPQTDRRHLLKSRFSDGDRVPAYAQDALSALLKQNIWLTTPAHPDQLDLHRPINKGELAVLLYEVLAAQKQVPPIPPPQAAQVTKLEVSLSERRVTAFKGSIKHRTYPIAVGRQGWETPKGTFKVKQKFARPDWKNPFTGDVIKAGDPDNPLGQYWIGFWTNGKDWSGFHGTPNRNSVGQAVSHGCLRMYSEDIKELFALVSTETIVEVSR
ncbi:MAG: L,D-transpeptidase family protein [Cyanobacteria bacterium KgW148]|nr:L,D-transpeptidase family protein [Cyanobacteria bacterium KgW148]